MTLILNKHDVRHLLTLADLAAVGSVLHHNAREAGRGTEVPTDWFTELETP